MTVNEKEEKYIVVEGLHKYFSQRGSEQMHILDDINFSVEKGEVICIVGSRAAAKARCCAPYADLTQIMKELYASKDWKSRVLTNTEAWYSRNTVCFHGSR